MLLLLRSPAGAVSASVGIAFGLSGGGTIATATLDMQLGLAPPTAVEANIFVTPDIHFGLSGISAGFVTRTASLDTVTGLSALGGFSAQASAGIVTGLSGTVGSVLQGIASPDIVLGISGDLRPNAVATADTVLGLTGTATISGGTLSVSASIPMTFGLTTSSVIAGVANADIRMGLNATGTGYLIAAQLPTVPYVSGIGPWDITIRTYG